MAESPTTIWGERADDWAEVMEGPSGWGIAVYEEVLGHLPVEESTRLLDVGCGAGRFCRIAADRGARVAGLDATSEFVEIARERVPEGEFEVGDMENLPWPDDTFDVVTGFNSFFVASDMVAALREARRVARPGGALALTIFGRPENGDSTCLFAAMSRLVEGKRDTSGEADSTADEGPALHEEDVILGVVREAGLDPQEAAYFRYVEEYEDLGTMARGFLAAPPGRRAEHASSADAVRDVLSDAAQHRVTDSGSVRLQEEVRYVIAAT